MIGPERGPAGGFRGDNYGIVSFSPPVVSRLVRLRRQGAAVELPAHRRMHWMSRVGIALAVILVGTAQIGCTLLLTAVALTIDLLILTPVLMLTHGVLRNWLPG